MWWMCRVNYLLVRRSFPSAFFRPFKTNKSLAFHSQTASKKDSASRLTFVGRIVQGVGIIVEFPDRKLEVVDKPHCTNYICFLETEEMATISFQNNTVHSEHGKGQVAPLQIPRQWTSVLQDVDERIESMLAWCGREWGADRAYLFLMRGNTMHNTHEWVNSDVKVHTASARKTD